MYFVHSMHLENQSYLLRAGVRPDAAGVRPDAAGRSYRQVVGGSPRLALHEAIHHVKELLDALVNAQLLPSLHNPLVLPACTPNKCKPIAAGAVVSAGH